MYCTRIESWSLRSISQICNSQGIFSSCFVIFILNFYYSEHLKQTGTRGSHCETAPYSELLILSRTKMHWLHGTTHGKLSCIHITSSSVRLDEITKDMELQSGRKYELSSRLKLWYTTLSLLHSFRWQLRIFIHF